MDNRVSGGSYYSNKARQISNKIASRVYQPGEYFFKHYLTNFETSENENLYYAIASKEFILQGDPGVFNIACKGGLFLGPLVDMLPLLP